MHAKSPIVHLVALAAPLAGTCSPVSGQNPPRHGTFHSGAACSSSARYSHLADEVVLMEATAFNATSDVVSHATGTVDAKPMATNREVHLDLTGLPRSLMIVCNRPSDGNGHGHVSDILNTLCTEPQGVLLITGSGHRFYDRYKYIFYPGLDGVNDPNVWREAGVEFPFHANCIVRAKIA